jgi:hypothetical protein
VPAQQPDCARKGRLTFGDEPGALRQAETDHDFRTRTKQDSSFSSLRLTAFPCQLSGEVDGGASRVQAQAPLLLRGPPFMRPTRLPFAPPNRLSARVAAQLGRRRPRLVSDRLFEQVTTTCPAASTEPIVGRLGHDCSLPPLLRYASLPCPPSHAPFSSRPSFHPPLPRSSAGILPRRWTARAAIGPRPPPHRLPSSHLARPADPLRWRRL